MTPILIILLLFAVVIAAVLPALLNRSRIAQDEREQSNADIALERMQEIKGMDSQDRIEAEDEIKNSLLEDAKATETASSKIIPFRHSLWIPVFLIGVSAGLYFQIGSPSLMFDASLPAQAEATHTPESIEAMIRQLEERIQDDPDNIEALQIAGQVYSTIGDSAKAETTYRRLNELAPGNPDYLTGLANAVILNSNDVYTPEAESFVRQALTIDPQHQNALWISALGASSRGEIESSIEQLEVLLALVEDEEEVRQSLLTMIEQQRAILSGNETEQGQAVEGKTLTVKVALDERLSGMASPTDTVFVVARAAGGPPAPLAVRKLVVGDLPITVNLSSAHSMIESMTVDNFEDIVIQARISKSGTAQSNLGDLVSKSILIAGKPSNPLHLIINDILE
ncbi:MAG: c-type cytochrome biogenesis protein CcmI [Gammaproteobacteria bacterium]|nr:c-type cytochrome biogenesis protein CcmI [Gammaproteobacteria bacterium]